MKNRVGKKPVEAGLRDDHGQASVAPGKRTLTMNLTGGSPTRGAPVRPRSAPVDAATQMKRAADTARWMDTAMRPDLYPAPVQRKGAGDVSGLPLPSDGGGHAMPQPVQAKMEQAFGADFSAVRIHEGPSAHALGARAYTQGTNVHFAPGEYQPGSHSGQALLGHELAHVVQQSQGRVNATAQLKGVGLNDDSALEIEADEMGARAARGERVGGGTPAGLASAGAGAGVQRAKLPAGAGQSAIQRVALAADKLNVVGENHEDSRPRRPRELALLTEKTGATAYWEEQQFRVDVAGVHRGDERRDTQQADPSLERARYALAEFGRVLDRAKRDYALWVQEPVEGEDEDGELDVDGANLDEDFDGANLDENLDGANLDENLVGADLNEDDDDFDFDAEIKASFLDKWTQLRMKAGWVHTQLNDTAVQELSKHLHHIDQDTRPDTDRKPIVRIITFIGELVPLVPDVTQWDEQRIGAQLALIDAKARQIVAACEEARWIGNSDTTDIFDDPTAVQVDSRIERSKGMHDAGNRNAHVLGMWKIGEDHVTDIKDLIDSGDVDDERYNLLTKDEFGQIYDERYGD